MWPDERRRKQPEEEQQPLTELFDIDWRETSFVPAGDNPRARIVFWKQDPASLLTGEEIEQVFDEVEKTDEGRSGVTTKQFTKRADVFAEAERRARILKQEQPEEYGDKSVAALRGHIMAADEALREALAALPPEEPGSQEPEPEVEPVMAEKAREPYAELHRVAKAELPDLYRRSPSAAVTEISKSRPDLVGAYSQAARSS